MLPTCTMYMEFPGADLPKPKMINSSEIALVNKTLYWIPTLDVGWIMSILE